MPKTYKIFVIDDEQVIRNLFARILTVKGHEVMSVDNGKDALQKVMEQSFDIVFTDMVMPGMDGIVTFKALRKLKPNLPIVIMTGFAVEDKIKEAMKLGAVDYLYKPFDISDIISILKRLERKKELKPVENS